MKFTYPVSYYFLLATDYTYVVTYVYLYKLLRWCEESWFAVRHGCSFDFQERLVESEGRPNQDANCKPVSLFYTIGYQCRSSSPLGRVGYCRSGQLCICFGHSLAAVVERGLGRGNFRRSRCLAVTVTALFEIATYCNFYQFHCYGYFWDYSLESHETNGTSIFKVTVNFLSSWVLQSYKSFQGVPLW